MTDNADNAVVIEFSTYTSRAFRARLARGLRHWADTRGYPMTWDEDRGLFGSRYWIQLTVPAADAAAVRGTELDGIDGARWRQLRWAWTHGRGQA